MGRHADKCRLIDGSFAPLIGDRVTTKREGGPVMYVYDKDDLSKVAFVNWIPGPTTEMCKSAYSYDELEAAL